MSLSKRYKRQPLHFEVIPIIDVMFTLMIFFVIYASTVSSLSNQGIKMKLPAAASVVKESHGTVITIDESLNVYLDGALTPVDEVRDRIAAQFKADPELSVILSADHTVPYETVVQLLDSIRLAGVHKVSLEAQKKTDAPNNEKRE